MRRLCHGEIFSRGFARQPHIDRVWTKFDVVIPSELPMLANVNPLRKFPVMLRREEFLAGEVSKIHLPFRAIGEADIDMVRRQRSHGHWTNHV